MSNAFQHPEYWQNRKVVVLGAARSGLAAAELLQRKGNQVIVSERGAIDTATQSWLKAHHIAWEEGGHQDATLQQADILIASPGIPVTAPPFVLAQAHGIPVISEIELASAFARVPMIAITGSNGKTTTVSLVHALLQQAGLRSGCGGNIGTPLISLVEGDFDYLVVEISSFQMETTFSFRPYIGVLLNIYPNHLDRHGDMASYFAAKKRLFQAQTTTDFAVLNRDNPESWSLATQLPSQIRTFSREGQPPHQATLHNGSLMWQPADELEPLLPIEELPLKGAHNIENYLAVASIAAILGIPGDIVRQTFRSINVISHRLEFVRSLAQRTFINDSKATNYLATVKAIESLEGPLVLIAGGQDKGGDISSLAAAIQARVAHVILLGEAADSIRQRLTKTGYNQITVVDSMEQAVQQAFHSAQAGDTILLSPACASYDMFRNFEERGEVFKRHVHALNATP
jgi:UDP-N-acetylmuramoylalanine--D-glutamate ligase